MPGGFFVRHAPGITRGDTTRNSPARKNRRRAPGCQTAGPVPRFPGPLDQRMDEFKIALALAAYSRFGGTSPGAANIVAKLIRISSRFRPM